MNVTVEGREVTVSIDRGPSLVQALYASVVNAESTTILKGQAVYLYQAQGNKASVKLAYNTTDSTSAKTLGLAAENISANQSGLVITQGVLSGINAGAYSEGDTLYLGATAGSVTATKPQAPNHLVYIGVVERANAGNGQIYVRCQNGYELDEIHDVRITSLQSGQFLLYTGSLWENVDYFPDKTGYSSGGSVTQNTSKSTSVSLNAPTGQVVLNNSALPAGEVARFTLTNSVIEANDVVVVNRKSGGSVSSYQIWCDGVSAGSCAICIQNITGGSLSESVTIQFAILKGSI